MNSKIASPRFDGARVLTVGDTMLDRYWHGSTNRISAEAPIPVVDISETEERLGGAANVALNVAALGAQASLVGAIGDDDSGRIISSKLATAGIQDLLKTFPDLPTITKYRIVSRKQQLVRADFEKVQDIAASHFSSRLDTGINSSDVVVLSDYDKGVLASPAAFIEAARAQAKPVLVDPKFKDFAAYAGATLVKPNQKEFVSAVGQWQTEAEMVNKCQTMMSNLGFEAMLITRGSEGMTLVQKGQQAHHLPAQNRDVYDVSGAGDTVIAVLATALAAGMTLIDAMMLSNIAAGIVVGRLGTDSVSGPELRLAVDEVSGNQGVMSEEQLHIAVDEARSRGEKVVFTNGCFDILHAGHVDYLKEAKQEGDRLIVAINDDHSVHKLKGEGRPINALDRRLTMLAGLASVDWVLSFSGDTPEALLATLKPDVLVKGGDYGIDQVVGADIVRGYGGDVKVLKLVDGLSTTSLAEKIKRL
ncbi:MAG: bifunctional D-glycero-beta-D-manno-heptose-7-phosphate kinase/D-glycero-beta-D-manno-heptose 1-phosphate adenylyltransferase HldE [Pseudomonadales bacterium]|jgi:D-beta-D-heptose 7-phosphate kinase/D-beta-D-heptose 1-phosphate adenosyltransferase|nr:bifunctional D-glycero-beta-D-manno-heptose-7-phosphate kinase/D-glycero-beta-D-manno-heptose 1-phosphate adenylyltransferase HldE [Pseudomonadales bacterium]MDG1442463.1 bifunctional D-glycero-beta-D-manno-heptose-7-phosphate kinase/D-glycero-beta-D-manno-heptose 1-phosphate adenylyltransferase HldE [Pseudomonadales bacterium]